MGDTGRQIRSPYWREQKKPDLQLRNKESAPGSHVDTRGRNVVWTGGRVCVLTCPKRGEEGVEGARGAASGPGRQGRLVIRIYGATTSEGLRKQRHRPDMTHSLLVQTFQVSVLSQNKN